MEVDPSDTRSFIYRLVAAVHMRRDSINVAHSEFLHLDSLAGLRVPVEGYRLRHRPADFFLPLRVGRGVRDGEAHEFGVEVWVGVGGVTATSARGRGRRDAREARVGNRGGVERIFVRHCLRCSGCVDAI